MPLATEDGAKRRTAAQAAADVAYRRLGSWRLLHLAAQGEMAEVYQARPWEAGEDRPAAYAVKVLKPKWEDDAEAVNCMRREALVGRYVACSHLISVLASQTARLPYFVVMPWLPGATLAQRLKSGWRPSIAAVLWIVRQAAQALDALHAAGWVHADIKPANLLLSPQYHLTVLDLGFARRPDEINTAADRCVLGTINYIAPEVLTAAHRADIRSDIYSLGVVFFELLTGHLPFRGDDLSEIVRQHREARPANVRRSRPQLSKHASRLLYDMLAKLPLRRPQTPAELLERLLPLEIEALAERL